MAKCISMTTHIDLHNNIFDNVFSISLYGIYQFSVVRHLCVGFFFRHCELYNQHIFGILIQLLR